MNEHEQFLQDIGSDQNHGIDLLNQPFEQSVTPEKEPAVQEEDQVLDVDDSIIKPKNRREKRLMRKLDDEREASIFLSGKLAAQSEAKSLITEESDYLKGIEKIYGTDTPEAILATDLLKKAIIGSREDAKNAALAEFQAKQQQEFNQKRELASKLSSFVDDIEDTYGVELTQNQEKSFLTLLTKMSPKDKDGNVTSYADHHTVYEVFQERLKSQGSNNKAKELSARSMVQSGAATETTLPDDTAVRFLSENGII